MSQREDHAGVLAPVITAPLFAELHRSLSTLLRGLATEQWDLPTSAGAWRVRDIVAHLLDGDLRRIGIDRDGHLPGIPAAPIRTHADLVDWLARLNAEWVAAARRISPRLLMDMLDATGPIVAQLMSAHDPHGVATFPVAWAGQQQSPMWLDIGREFTERWHHQDQVREAVAAPPLDDARLLRPVLEVSLLAVPPALAAATRPAGAELHIVATGAVSAHFAIRTDGKTWQLVQPSRDPACTATADALVLARILLHRIRPDLARERIHIEGDAELGDALLRARAVMV